MISEQPEPEHSLSTASWMVCRCGIPCISADQRKFLTISVQILIHCDPIET